MDSILGRFTIYRMAVGGYWVHWTNYAGWFRVDAHVHRQYSAGMVPSICDRLEDRRADANNIRIGLMIAFASLCFATAITMTTFPEVSP